MHRTLIAAALLRLTIAALLAAAMAPAFARGQPQLPNDDGGRASVLSALDPWFDPHRMGVHTRPAAPHAAPISRAPSAIPRVDNSAPADR